MQEVAGSCGYDSHIGLTELATRELGEDYDWSAWAAPEAVVPAVVFLASQTPATFTGRIVSSPAFGIDWP